MRRIYGKKLVINGIDLTNGRVEVRLTLKLKASELVNGAAEMLEAMFDARAQNARGYAEREERDNLRHLLRAVLAGEPEAHIDRLVS